MGESYSLVGGYFIVEDFTDDAEIPLGDFGVVKITLMEGSGAVESLAAAATALIAVFTF